MYPMATLRAAVMGVSLTLACTAAALGAGVLTPRSAEAQQASTCSNTECHGVSYCVYAPAERCSMPDRNSCLNQRCAFADN